jgi:hypothetical protein
MPISRCPGQDNRSWRSEDLFEAPCPFCGRGLEFWKDEPRRRCNGCGKKVLNPRLDLGCAKWCQFASDCLGMNVQAAKEESLCQSVIGEMSAVFGQDRLRITHALEVLNWAEMILQAEPADPLVVKAAAVLHDIGIAEAERKHGSAAARYQEQEGPPIARAILQRLQVDAQRVEHVCRIVGSHHSAGEIDTPEFRIVWDADQLVNLSDSPAQADRGGMEQLIARTFRTDAGKTLARGKLLGGEASG